MKRIGDDRKIPTRPQQHPSINGAACVCNICLLSLAGVCHKRPPHVIPTGKLNLRLLLLSRTRPSRKGGKTRNDTPSLCVFTYAAVAETMNETTATQTHYSHIYIYIYLKVKIIFKSHSRTTFCQVDMFFSKNNNNETHSSCSRSNLEISL